MAETYTILLVDDEPDIRRAVRRTLAAPGYSFLEVDDGAAALALLERQRVDAVVSDYNMPAMNGLDLLAQVRDDYPEIVRILLTARADVHLAVGALNDGIVHRFLLKPWDHVDLRGIVQMTIHTLRTDAQVAAAALK